MQAVATLLDAFELAAQQYVETAALHRGHDRVAQILVEGRAAACRRDRPATLCCRARGRYARIPARYRPPPAIRMRSGSLSRWNASSEVMHRSPPGTICDVPISRVGRLPVAMRILSAVTRRPSLRSRDGMRILEHGAVARRSSPRRLRRSCDRWLRGGDLLVLVGDQGRPVEARLADAPAIAGGVVEILAEMAGIDEQLLGMQPRITQVPPRRYSSASATRAPPIAAMRLALTPPEPPPMTKRS